MIGYYFKEHEPNSLPKLYLLYALTGALVAGLGDKLAKLSAVIEKLDKKANVVDVIEVFMAFSKWIEYRSTIDPEVTPELVRAINKYQDLYITEQMGIK